MTKTQLQVALAPATETTKRTAGVFLDTLRNLAYKAIKRMARQVYKDFAKALKLGGPNPFVTGLRRFIADYD